MTDRKERPAAPAVTSYPRPAVAVDLVVLTIVDALLHVLLVRRQSAHGLV